MVGNSATLEKRKVLSNYSLIIVEIYLKYLNCLQNKQQYDSIIKRKNYEDLGITYLDRKGEITTIERK